MKSKHAFYTQRIAKLYLDQGYLDDAETAYRALAGKDPACEDYASGLSRVARMKRERKKTELIGLVRAWTDLLQREKQREHAQREGS